MPKKYCKESKRVQRGLLLFTSILDITLLLSAEVREIVEKYKNLPVSEVVFALQKLPADLRIAIAEQIQAYQKAKSKIPSFCQNSKIIFPPKLNLEQASSEITATWKARNIIQKADLLTDLTGGFGVDAWAFSQVSQKVNYVEQNKDLAEIAKHNFGVLEANIEVFSEQAFSFLQKKIISDWIYIDPARRDNAGKSIAQITDTEPNILELLSFIFQKTNNLLLKTSPMFDISQALDLLSSVEKVWIIAVENECKEVLYWIKKPNPNNFNKEKIAIEAVSIQTKGAYSSLKANILQEKNAEIKFSPPQKYLYEPNSAILKAGFFKFAGNYFDLMKLHTHTHFYTHQALKSDFQGRVFEIQNTLTHFDWKTLKKDFPQANIIARNYPLSVEQIRKKSQIKEGGDIFIIFTTWHENHKGAIVAKKVKNIGS